MYMYIYIYIHIGPGVNRAVFAQVPKGSRMFKVLEVVAAKHMDHSDVNTSHSSIYHTLL